MKIVKFRPREIKQFFLIMMLLSACHVLVHCSFVSLCPQDGFTALMGASKSGYADVVLVHKSGGLT